MHETGSQRHQRKNDNTDKTVLALCPECSTLETVTNFTQASMLVATDCDVRNLYFLQSPRYLLEYYASQPFVVKYIFIQLKLEIQKLQNNIVQAIT